MTLSKLCTHFKSASKMKLCCALLISLACWIQISSSTNETKQRKIATILGEDDQVSTLKQTYTHIHSYIAIVTVSLIIMYNF